MMGKEPEKPSKRNVSSSDEEDPELAKSNFEHIIGKSTRINFIS